MAIFLRVLFWIASAQLAFAAVGVMVWQHRLDALRIAHDSWLPAFVHVWVASFLPAALAYGGALVAIAVLPADYKLALQARPNDLWAYVMAILAGGFFALYVFSALAI